jgi:6-phosphogluconolactonase
VTVVHRFPDGASVARNVAEQLIKSLTELLSTQELVNIMLTGGTVGIASLAELGSHELRDSIDYSRVHFWWGDERYVPRNHADRNALQARNAFLNKIKVAESNVHEFPASDSGLSLDEAATQFAEAVDNLKPKFDIVLLGMGPDGHVASLFPNKEMPSPGVKVIAEHDSPKPPSERLSFTYEAINSADQVWFVVAGADKQDAVAVAMGDTPQNLPVGLVHGTKATHWFIDSTAGTKVFGC